LEISITPSPVIHLCDSRWWSSAVSDLGRKEILRGKADEARRPPRPAKVCDGKRFTLLRRGSPVDLPAIIEFGHFSILCIAANCSPKPPIAGGRAFDLPLARSRRQGCGGRAVELIWLATVEENRLQNEIWRYAKLRRTAT
jgi:hypothetical protein